MFTWLHSLFTPESIVGSKLDGTSWNYYQRLERANLPYRTFNEVAGVRIVKVTEGPAAPPAPAPGTRESRLLWAS
jgi:hypothetical protein